MPKNKKVIAGAVLAVVLFLLIVTNPTKEDFKDYIQYKIDQTSKKKTGIDWLTSKGTQLIAGQVVNFSSITRHNYIIFSVYIVDLPPTDDDIKVYGCMGIFF